MNLGWLESDCKKLLSYCYTLLSDDWLSNRLLLTWLLNLEAVYFDLLWKLIILSPLFSNGVDPVPPCPPPGLVYFTIILILLLSSYYYLIRFLELCFVNCGEYSPYLSDFITLPPRDSSLSLFWLLRNFSRFFNTAISFWLFLFY